MNRFARFPVGVAVLWIVPTLALAQATEHLSLLIPHTAAQPDSTCAANQRGDVVCTKPGGGMMSDQYGEQLCGPGYCVKDQRGNVLCSRQPRGGATVDQSGKAVCAGGCVPGTKEACARPSE